MKTLLIIAGVILLVLVTGAVLFFKFFAGSIGPVTLTYQGLWEPESVFSEVVADYHRLHPNVTVKYQKSSPINYRDRLTAALAEGSGPDIVRIHNSWLPMLKNSLAPVPASVYSPSTFQSAFYPAAVSDLTVGGQPYAIPLEIDTLVMFVNQDILTAGGATIPTTWEDFSPTASKLTVRDSSGHINTAGAALGSATNVDHWQDIVSLMMLQAGVNLNSQPNSQAAQEAMGFYTGFESADHDWDETLDNSTLAFANGKVAFYFAPSWRAFDIKAINPNLNFKIVPVPQLSGGKAVNYASYWAEAVSKKSSHQKEAWDFLQYLSSKDVLTKLYSSESKIRDFGEPYSRTDMASLLSSDPNAGVVISQAPTAQGWYLASFTADGDTGINSKIGKYYEDAVNSINRGTDIKSALDLVASGVSQVLNQYGIVSAVPLPTR